MYKSIYFPKRMVLMRIIENAFWITKTMLYFGQNFYWTFDFLKRTWKLLELFKGALLCTLRWQNLLNFCKVKILIKKTWTLCDQSIPYFTYLTIKLLNMSVVDELIGITVVKKQPIFGNENIYCIPCEWLTIYLRTNQILLT